MDAAPRYADWKAPADDGAHLIWPDPGQILRDTTDNAERLSAAHGTRVQNVPLPELRGALRRRLGHSDAAGPLIATGHQTELHHPGVWVKNVLIDVLAEKLTGQAYQVAVDIDEPKHLHLRWPGGSEPLIDQPLAASWSGLLDAPSPAHLSRIQQEINAAAAGWDFQPMIARFLDTMRRLALEEKPKLPTALSNSLHSLDRELGLRHQAMVFSPICSSEAYLVLAHHVLARARPFAEDYNAALDEYRREHKVRTAGRPMPNLNVSDDLCEVPFWLDELATGGRFRASVVRMGNRWALRAPASVDEIFVFDPAADGWDAANQLLRWLRQNDLRLSPRALTLTLLLRLVIADQFVHGIGGARYDQITDTLIARHFGLEPPRFAVTTATLYFPGAAEQSRACMACVMHEGHRLRHNVLGNEKRQLVEGIAAAPRGSPERSKLYFQMHGKLAAAAARHPEIARWEQRKQQAEAREQEERVIFDRELFYALQSEDRLRAMIDRYREHFM